MMMPYRLGRTGVPGRLWVGLLIACLIISLLIPQKMMAWETGGVSGSPQNLRPVRVTDTEVQLAWDTVSGAEIYDVYRAETGAGVFNLIVSEPGAGYTDSGLVPGRNYWYKVATRSDTESFCSTVLSVTTAALPAAVQGLAAQVRPYQVVLSWQPVSQATEYRIYRSDTEAGHYTVVGTSTSNGFLDVGLEAEAVYWYRVSAVFNSVEGEKSQALRVQIPGTLSGMEPVTLANGTGMEISRNIPAGQGDLHSTAFSADGLKAATGGSDGTVKVWQVADGTLLLTLQAHEDDVYGIAFNPDGQSLATASRDKTVKLWDLTTGEMKRSFADFSYPVYSVSYSPDGETLATGSGDSKVALWNTLSGELIRNLEGHTGFITSVSFSPDGQKLISGSGDHTCRIWRVSDGFCLKTLSSHNGTVWDAEFSPDGQEVVTASADGSVKLWQVSNGSLLKTFGGGDGGVKSASFSLDGRMLIAGAADGVIRIWSKEAGVLMKELAGHTGTVTCLALRSDGGMMVSVSEDGTAKFWASVAPDRIPPLFLHALLDESGTVIELIFNENLTVCPGIDLSESISLAEDEGYFTALGANDTVQISGNKVTITLEQAIGGSAAKFRLAADSLQDRQGNSIREIITGELSPQGKTADLQPPFYLGGGLGATPGQIILAFSEEIFGRGDLTALKAALALARDGENFASLSPEDWVYLAGRNLAINLKQPLDGTIGKLKIAAHCLADEAGNELAYEVLTQGIIVPQDTVPPQFIQAGFLENKRTVALRFSEEITAAMDQSMLTQAVSYGTDGETFVPLGPNDTVLLDGNILKIVFGNVLNTASLTVKVMPQALADKTGNIAGEITAPVSGYLPRIITPSNLEQLEVLGTLGGNVDDVYALAYSPDSTRLAISVGWYNSDFYNPHWNYEVKIIRLSDGVVEQTLSGLTLPVYALAYSHDGKLLASAANDGNVVLWDTANGTALCTLPHTQGVNSMAYSPDDRILATTSWDRAVRLWSTNGAELLQSFDQAEAFAFAPGSNLIAVGGEDQIIRLWQWTDKTLLKSFKGHQDGITGLTFTPDGQMLASVAADGWMRLWRTSDEKVLREIFGGPSIEYLAMDPAGRYLLTAGNEVKFWDIANGGLIRTIPGISSNNAAVSPDGSKIAWGASSGYEINTAKVWAVSSDRTPPVYQYELLDAAATGIRLYFDEEIAAVNEGSVKSRIELARDGIQFSPLGADDTVSIENNQVVITLSSPLTGNKNLIKVQANSLKDICNNIISADVLTQPIRVTPLIRPEGLDGLQLLAAYDDHAEIVTDTAVSSDGTLLATASRDRTVKIRRAADGLLLQDIRGFDSWVQAIAFSPDGTLLAVGSGDHTVQIRRVQDGQLLKSLTGPSGIINDLGFTPDGKKILACSSDGGIYFWQTASGSLLTRAEGQAEMMYMAISPDGQIAAAGGKDGIIKLWRVDDGSLLESWNEHTAEITGIVFSPDGQNLASVSLDGRLKYCQVLDGQVLQEIDAAAGPLQAVAISPDGRILALGAIDGSLLFWPIGDQGITYTTQAHTGTLNALVFLPDGRSVVSAGSDRLVKRWGFAADTEAPVLRDIEVDDNDQTVKLLFNEAIFNNRADEAALKNGITLAVDGSHFTALGEQDTVELSGSQLVIVFGTPLRGTTNRINIAANTLQDGFDNIQGQALLTDPLALNRDTAPPLYRRVAVGPDNREITLVFSEAVVSAENQSLYQDVMFAPDGVQFASLDPEAEITLQSNRLVITLDQPLTADTGKIMVTAGALTDEAGNELPEDVVTPPLVCLSPVLSGNAEQMKKVKELTGCMDGINSVAVGTDGQVIVSGDDGGQARFWSMPDGKTVIAHTGNLSGGSGRASVVALSPDNNRIAVGAPDGSISLLDSGAGTVQDTLSGHWNKINALAWSPDGVTLASGGTDLTVRLWDTAACETIKVLTGYAGNVLALAFSQDGSFLAVGYTDNVIKVYRVNDGSLVYTLNGHSRPVTALAFSPNSQVLASGSEDSTIKLWQMSSGSLARSWVAHNGTVHSLAFSPDGTLLAGGGGDYALKLWQADDGALVRTLTGHTGKVAGLAWSRDGRVLVSGSSDKRLMVWGIPAQTDPPAFSGASLDNTNKVIFLNFSQSLASNLPEGTELKTMVSLAANGTAFLPLEAGDRVEIYGQQLVVTLEEPLTGSLNKIKVIGGTLKNTKNSILAAEVVTADLAADETPPVFKTVTIDESNRIVQLTFSENIFNNTAGDYEFRAAVLFAAGGVNFAALGESDQVFIAGNTLTLQFARGLNGSTNKVKVLGNTLRDAAGNVLADDLITAALEALAAISADNTASISKLRTINASDALCMALSPDGQTIVSGTTNNALRFWRVSDGAVLNTVYGHSNWVQTVAFSPNGEMVASGALDDTVKVWNAVSHAHLRTLNGHTNDVLAVAFSPDNQTLASAGRDNTIRLWSAGDGTFLRTLSGHTSSVQKVVFSPDGLLLASASNYDGTLRLWDPKDGSLVRTISGYAGGVAFSPDGETLVMGAGGNSLNFYRVDDGTLIRTISGGHTSSLKDVAYSPDGQLVVSGANDYTAKIWNDGGTGALHSLVHPQAVHQVIFAPGNKMIVTLDSSRNLNLWAVQASADSEPPVYLSASLDDSGRTVTLTFNEALSSNLTAEQLKAAVQAARDGENFCPLTGSDTVAISGPRLVICLAGALAGKQNVLRIDANSLGDKAGNILAEDVVTEAIYAAGLFNQNQGGFGGYQHGAYDEQAELPTADVNWTLQSSYIGPNETTVQWSFSRYRVGPYYGSSVIGRDGTIYVGAADYSTYYKGYIYALTPAGSQRWVYQTSSTPSSPAIGADGTVYVSAGSLYALNPDNGIPRWTVSGSFDRCAPVIADDGTIYAVSGDTLYAFAGDGSEIWRYSTGGQIQASPCIGADGTVYLGSSDYQLYALNPDGSLRWKFATGRWIESSPAVGKDGTIYVGSCDGKLYAVKPDGTQKWAYATGGEFQYTPALGRDGAIYVGSDKLYALNSNGTLKWSYGTSAGAVILDGAGVVYAIINRALTALNQDGSLKWQMYSWDLDGDPSNVPVIGSDGTIYLGVQDSIYGCSLKAIGSNLPPGIDYLELDDNSIYLRPNDVYQCQVTAVYNNDDEVDATKLAAYISDNPAVAEVDAQGLVTARSEGFAEITVSYEGKAESLYIFVDEGNEPPQVEVMWLTPYLSSALELNYLQTYQLSLMAAFNNNITREITEEATISSSQPLVATVGQDGIITGRNRGTALITLAYGTEVEGVTVEVSNAPCVISHLQLDSANYTLAVGSTHQTTAWDIYSDGSQQAAENLNYVSSDSSVARVDSQGVVYGLKPGNTVLSVSHDGYTAEAFITVYQGIEEPFNQSNGSGGYQAGGYDLAAAQPGAYNWTRQSRFAGSDDLPLLWRYDSQSAIASSPAVGRDGTLYFCTYDGDLCAVSPDGTLKWSSTVGRTYASPVIAEDGTVYTSNSQSLLAFSPSGAKLWAFTVSLPSVYYLSHTSPVLAKEGTVYLGLSDGYFYAVNPDGTQKWKLYTGDVMSSAAVAPDGTIFAGTRSQALLAIHPSGAVKWKVSLSGIPNEAPLLAADGTVYIGTDKGTFYAIGANGTVKWVREAGAGFKGASIASDGTIYVGNDDGKLYAFNSQGLTCWYYNAGSSIVSAPLSDKHGSLYFGTGEGKVIELTPGGDFVWSYQTGDRILTAPALNNMGTLFVTSWDGSLYAFGVEETLPEVEGILVDGDTFSLAAGSSRQLVVKGMRADGSEVVLLEGLLYSTADPEIAEVSQDGVITGLQAGSTILTVAYGDYSLALPIFIFEGSFDQNFCQGSYLVGQYQAGGMQPTVFNWSRQARFAGPTGPNPYVKWSYRIIDSSYNGQLLSSRISSSPVLGEDGTIYIGTEKNYEDPYFSGNGGRLYAFNPDGSIKWYYAVPNSGGIINASPAIGADGTVYLASGRLYALNPDGTLKWVLQAEGGTGGTPAIGPDGTVYAFCGESGSSGVCAVSPRGELKWRYQGTGSYSYGDRAPVLAGNESIYLALGTKIIAINMDGREQWSFETGRRVNGSPILGTSGELYLATDTEVISLSEDGSLRWRTAVGYNCSGLVLRGATLYFHSADMLYELDQEGNLLKLTALGNGYSSDNIHVPVLDADGNMYFGVSDNKVYGLDPNGDLLWIFTDGNVVHSQYADQGFYSSPALGADGTVYIGNYDGYFYAIGTRDAASGSQLLTAEGYAEITPEEGLREQVSERITLTYHPGENLFGGTVQFTVPIGFTLDEGDAVSVLRNDGVYLWSHLLDSVSCEEQTVTLYDMNLDTTQTIELALIEKTLPSPGEYTFSVRADADGPATDSIWSNWSEAEFTVIENGPPAYERAVVDDTFNAIELVFNKNIALTAAVTDLKAAVTLAEDGENFAALQPEDTVEIIENNLVITFVQPLAGSSNKIKVAANTLQDLYGNVITEEIITGAINALTPAPIGQVYADGIPVSDVEATFVYSGGELQIVLMTPEGYELKDLYTPDTLFTIRIDNAGHIPQYILGMSDIQSWESADGITTINVKGAPFRPSPQFSTELTVFTLIRYDDAELALPPKFQGMFMSSQGAMLYFDGCPIVDELSRDFSAVVGVWQEEQASFKAFLPDTLLQTYSTSPIPIVQVHSYASFEEYLGIKEDIAVTQVQGGVMVEFPLVPLEQYLIFHLEDPGVTPPPQPTQLTAAEVKNDEITLTWEPEERTQTYNIYRASAEDGEYSLVGSSVDNTYADSGLVLNTTYWYKVAAVNINGEGPLSEALVVTTLNTAYLQTDQDSFEVAESIGSLAVTVTRSGNLDNSVSLDYTTSDLTAAAGEDYLAAAGTITFEPGEVVKEIELTILNDRGMEDPEDFKLVFSNLTAGTELTSPTEILIRILDNDRCMLLSENAESESTLWQTEPDGKWLRTDVDCYNGSYAWLPVVENNAGHRLVSPYFSLTGLTNAKLEYAHHYDLEEDYDYGYVEVWTDAAGTWETLKTYNGSAGWATESIDLTAYCGQDNLKVRFRYVTDFSFLEEGWYVDDIRVVADIGALSQPTGLVASDVTAHSLTLSWDAVAAADGYLIYRTTDDLGPYTQIGTSDQNSFTDNSLDSGKKYWYKVSAVKGGGEGPQSEELEVTTLAPAEIQFDDLGAIPVSEDEAEIMVEVIRSGNLSGTVSVDYATEDGSALQGEDYQAVDGTLTFEANETRKTISIPLINDSEYEQAEAFYINLFSPSNDAQLGEINQAKIEIQENDGQSFIGFTAASGIVNESAGTLEITLERTGNSDQPCEATVFTEGMAPGVTGGLTAADGMDYMGYYESVVFEEGETTKTVVLDILDDFEMEGPERFRLSLEHLSNAELSPVSVMHIIIEDDDSDVLLYDDGENASIPWEIDPAGKWALSSTRSFSGLYSWSPLAEENASNSLISPAFSLKDSTSAILKFTHWHFLELWRDWAIVEILKDDGSFDGLRMYNQLPEWKTEYIDLSNYCGQENLRLRFRFFTDSGITLEGWYLDDITILSGVRPPQPRNLSITAVTTTGVEFTWSPLRNIDSYNVYRATDEEGPYTLLTSASENSFTDNTLTAGTQYFYKVSGVKNDVEGLLSEPLSVTTGNPAVIELTSASYTAAEEAGSVVVEVRRSGSISDTVSVDYTLTDGSAASGEDYLETSGALIFEPEEEAKSITIPLLDDNAYEPEETFHLVLSGLSGEAVLGSTNQAIITIEENDYLESTGTVVYQTFEGGFFGIAGDDGENYRPINPLGKVQAGDIIKFKWIEADGDAGYQMWGKAIRILGLEVIEHPNLQIPKPTFLDIPPLVRRPSPVIEPSPLEEPKPVIEPSPVIPTDPIQISPGKPRRK